MPKILIVADDYTGANDTAVLAAKIGLSAYTILDPKAGIEELGQVDCAAVSTDSRAIPADAAYHAVREATDRYRDGETILFSKRIDSTLRGNLGAEIEGMLDALGPDRAAMIVPTFPGAGRIYKDGCLYVKGVPLSRTEAAMDPKNPITTDAPLELLKDQSSYKAENIRLEEVRGDRETLVERLRALREENVRLILFEAEDETDLDRITGAVQEEGSPFICVDPGAFTLACARMIGKGSEERKLLFVIGSVNQVTARQMEMLRKEPGTAVVYMDAEKVLEGETLTGEEPVTVGENDPLLREMTAALGTAEVICLCTSGIFPEHRLDLHEYEEKLGIPADRISERLNGYMAALAARLIEDTGKIRGLFACGGDTAVALCQALKARGEYPLEEVIPLAVYGRLVGGSADRMPIITKGGMVGDDGTLVRCRDFLNEKRREKDL